jgi:peptidylprolyl isomerase
VVLPGEEGRPDVPVPAGAPPSKLLVLDLKKGKGHPAEDGDELSVRYFSFAYRGHQIYEDDWRKPTPPFVLGQGQRDEAWESGLQGIRGGGRRELVVPGEKSFESAPEVYVIEALSIKPTKQANTPTISVKGTGPKPTLHYPPKPPKHVVVRILKEGPGPRVRPGDELAARYVGGNPNTGFVQDFWSEEDPYRFQLGKNRLGKAWEIGLKGMRLGGRRELVVPSRLAYGEGMMVYVIELLELEGRPPGR